MAPPSGIGTGGEGNAIRCKTHPDFVKYWFVLCCSISYAYPDRVPSGECPNVPDGTQHPPVNEKIRKWFFFLGVNCTVNVMMISPITRKQSNFRIFRVFVLFFLGDLLKQRFEQLIETSFNNSENEWLHFSISHLCDMEFVTQWRYQHHTSIWTCRYDG